MNTNLGLSYQARKALNVHIGESAGTEIANLLQKLVAQIEELKRTKVSITPVVPTTKLSEDLSAALEHERF